MNEKCIKVKEEPVPHEWNMDMNRPERFVNRELSWLQFNRRVLEEARNSAHPLLERLRFLSISASNLDEFYMVRVAGLKAQIATGAKSESADMMTPLQQLRAINKSASTLVTEQRHSLETILKEMSSAGIHIVDPAELPPNDRLWLEK